MSAMLGKLILLNTVVSLEVHQTTAYESKTVIIFRERLNLRKSLLTSTGVRRTFYPPL